MTVEQELANAIIIQASKDYLSGTDGRVKEIESFFRSDWFKVLSDLDPEYLIENLKKKKRKKNDL